MADTVTGAEFSDEQSIHPLYAQELCPVKYKVRQGTSTVN